jgi:PAS domain S-box-containing protein
MSRIEDSTNAGSGSGIGVDLDSIPDAVVIANSDTGRIVEANTAAGELFHCQPAELVGHHQSELHPSNHGDYEEAFRRAIDGQRVNRLQTGEPLYIETFDERHVPVEINAKRLHTSEGVLVLGVFREVTDQLDRERRLESAASRLETLLDALPVPVAVLGVDGTVARWNRAAEATFGYAAESVIGRPYPLFLEDEEFDELFEQVLNGGILDGYETAHRAQDGSRVPVELYARPIYESGTFSGIAGAAIDLSERQHREQQLDVLHRVLRHNLRNELTVIRGWAQQLDPVSPHEQNAVETISAASDRLLALSEEASRIRTGLTDDVQQTDSLSIPTAVSRLSEHVTEWEPATTMTVERSGPGAVPRRGVQAVSQLFDSVSSHADESTLELTIETHSQYLRLELTADAPVLPAGERTLIETGSETALEHGSDLAVAQAYLGIQSVGGEITIADAADAPPTSRLSVELPQTDVDASPARGGIDTGDSVDEPISEDI